MQKPYRKAVIETYGARVIPSPSDTTNVGRKMLEEFPGSTGSLGTAISEAVEVATSTENCRYALGSVLNQVLLHQSIIGLEAKQAMEKLDEYPDIVIGCAGGGSNLGGIMIGIIIPERNCDFHADLYRISLVSSKVLITSSSLLKTLTTSCPPNVSSTWPFT